MYFCNQFTISCKDNSDLLLNQINYLGFNVDDVEENKEAEAILCYCAFIGSIGCFKTLLTQGFPITNAVEICTCAGGNIAIIGSLRGVAHAGANGNTKAIITANNIDVTQVRIDNQEKEIEGTKDLMGAMQFQIVMKH